MERNHIWHQVPFTQQQWYPWQKFIELKRTILAMNQTESLQTVPMTWNNIKNHYIKETKTINNDKCLNPSMLRCYYFKTKERIATPLVIQNLRSTYIIDFSTQALTTSSQWNHIYLYIGSNALTSLDSSTFGHDEWWAREWTKYGSKYSG